ncbi:hypothetical protein TGPRC2_309025 [Toxoplasma gondii TgCatPRC2]|uniref:Uncharacterized protein n=2 Tax=Toxoplasma gondii TaxID=5811 RepID=A0A151HLH8_TOXGO|nr:hypothetical protein TGMAS_309025 [Toxoplasma gondii MAS]KYK70194.1 hypothetical protein TGPRC2_309025 [Toxoplasma gondii TgCatPRC2]
MVPEALLFPCLPVQMCQTMLSQRKTPAMMERVCSNRNVDRLWLHATRSAVFALCFITLFTSSSPSSAWLPTQFDPQMWYRETGNAPQKEGLLPDRVKGEERRSLQDSGTQEMYVRQKRG